jgi:hypothetical protein
MARFGSRSGFAPALAGAAMLFELALARVLFGATAAGVTFLGRPLPWYCAVRTQLGIPCPTCGITRAIVLALHGEFSAAWSLSPGGVAAVTGMAFLSASLLLLGWRQWSGRGAAAARWIRRGAVAWAGAAGVVWIGGWAVALLAALRLP